MHALPVQAIRAREHVHRPLRHEVGRCEAFELADVVGKGHELGMALRPEQRPVLRQELDVGDATRVLLEVELGGTGARQLRPHPLAHRSHVLAQRSAANGGAQQLDAQPLESRAQLRRAGDGTRAQERLVLPGPGLAALVVAKAIDALHEQPALAARPQPGIHLIQPSRRRVHGQHVHQPLHEAQEEDAVVDDGRPVGPLHLA